VNLLLFWWTCCFFLALFMTEFPWLGNCTIKQHVSIWQKLIRLPTTFFASFEAGAGAMHPPKLLKFALLLSFALAFCPQLSRAIAAGPQESIPSNARDQPKQASVRLDSLVEELLSANPELQAARKRYEAALTRPAQESALPDPRITAGWASNGWPYPGAGLGSEAGSNIGLQVAQEIPFPGKRALKGGIAQKEADSEAQAVRAMELRLVAQLKERYYELLYIYEAVDLIHRNRELLQQMAKVTEARYSAGKAMQQDIIKAGIEVSILENRLIVLEQKRLSGNAEINALLNRPPEEDMGRPETISTLPPLEPFESLRARALTASPLLQGQRAVIDSRQLNMQSAQKAYYPDFDVMSGYYNQGAMKPMWEFKVQANIPLYFGKKQRYGLEEAGANLVEAQRTYRNDQQMLLFRLRDRYVAAEAALKLMDLYSRQVVPQSELALESSLASYEGGNVDFLTVLSNFTTIREYQINYFEQRADYLKALSGLEELTGTPGGPASHQGSSQNEVRR
jgi:outer membrane protein, heavy metal efflux system